MVEHLLVVLSPAGCLLECWGDGAGELGRCRARGGLHCSAHLRRSGGEDSSEHCGASSGMCEYDSMMVQPKVDVVVDREVVVGR